MQLSDNQVITLFLDDSHVLGVTYTEGGGIMKKLKQYDIFQKKPNLRIIIIASLAKALGIPGGVVFSDKHTIATIRNNPLFVGASPIIPAYLHAFLVSQDVYRTARTQLLDNINYFKNGCEEHKVSTSLFRFLPNYPVFNIANSSLYSTLYEHKIFISNFSYPLPISPPITRIILSALHTEGDIERLIKCIVDN